MDLSPYLYDDGLPSCWWTPTGDKTVHIADKSCHYSEISHFSWKYQSPTTPIDGSSCQKWRIFGCLEETVCEFLHSPLRLMSKTTMTSWGAEFGWPSLRSFGLKQPYAFTHTGIDSDGPYYIEFLDEMSSPCFINVIRRFCAVRGDVKIIHSDQGTIVYKSNFHKLVYLCREDTYHFNLDFIHYCLIALYLWPYLNDLIPTNVQAKENFKRVLVCLSTILKYVFL